MKYKCFTICSKICYVDWSLLINCTNCLLDLFSNRMTWHMLCDNISFVLLLWNNGIMACRQLYWSHRIKQDSLLTAQLSHNTYSMSQPTVALDPDGVVRVCTGQNQQFLCTSGGVSWNISGFGSGISDTSFPAVAIDLAKGNIRVTTTDNSTLANPSTLTFMMLEYPDDNASVTCLDSMRRSMTSTIRIGESAFRNV